MNAALEAGIAETQGIVNRYNQALAALGQMCIRDRHWSFTRWKMASKSVIPGKTGAIKHTVRMPAS